MGSSVFARGSAVVPFTPATDMTDKKGSLVTIAGETATLSASATVPAEGVILEGADTDGQVSVGILGAGIPPVFLKAGGAITKGAALVQDSDDAVIVDPGSGGRVKIGIALEAAAEDELFEAAVFTPQVLS
jgi:hypothetical protein